VPVWQDFKTSIIPAMLSPEIPNNKDIFAELNKRAAIDTKIFFAFQTSNLP
jgi:hypothetical protein